MQGSFESLDHQSRLESSCWQSVIASSHVTVRGQIHVIVKEVHRAVNHDKVAPARVMAAETFAVRAHAYRSRVEVIGTAGVEVDERVVNREDSCGRRGRITDLEGGPYRRCPGHVGIVATGHRFGDTMTELIAASIGGTTADDLGGAHHVVAAEKYVMVV